MLGHGPSRYKASEFNPLQRERKEKSPDAIAFEEALKDPSVLRQFREMELQTASAKNAIVAEAVKNPDILCQLQKMGLEAVSHVKKDSLPNSAAASSKRKCRSSSGEDQQNCARQNEELENLASKEVHGCSRHSRHVPKEPLSPERLLEEFLREVDQEDSTELGSIDDLIAKVVHHVEETDNLGPEQTDNLSAGCRRLQEMLQQEMEMEGSV